MPQQSVRFEQFFAAPREKVFAWFSDHEKFGRIFPGRTRRIRTATEGDDPNGLGSARRVGAWPMTFEETITGFRAPDLIEYRVTRGGPVRNHQGRMRFESVAGGTGLEYVIEFDPRIPFTGGLIAGLLCGAWRHGVQKAIEDITRT
jgi:uncharacterized protein YndB with AHSA1/START domain